MICKWCGAEINRAENRCNRCGRENSPLSDCGGFYDLVPQLAPASGQAAVKKGNSGMIVVVALLSLFLAASLALNAVLLVKKPEQTVVPAEETYTATQAIEKDTDTKSFDSRQEETDEDMAKKETAESETVSTVATEETKNP